MKLEEKYNTFEEQLTAESMACLQQTSVRKWRLKRPFLLLSALLGIVFFTVFYQQATSTPAFAADAPCGGTSAQKQRQHQFYTVLHTGFPPTTKSKLSGLQIEPNKAAAIAFSPDPAAFNKKSNDLVSQQNSPTVKFTKKDNSNESWWERLFPQHHVHLSFLQIPVRLTQAPSSKSCSCFFSSYERKPVNRTVKALLSICESKKEHFWSRRQVPNLEQCVDTVKVRTGQEDGKEADDEDDAGYLFGVLEWAPTTEAPVVLKKSKLYWLVVRTSTGDTLFEWIDADEQGRKEQGFDEGPYNIVYQSELGWEYKFDDEPIPSVIVRVNEHHDA